jgi:phage regulator Rha-like protein
VRIATPTCSDTQQDANQINANLALQQIVAQKQQQDAMKSVFRDSSGYESYYTANIATTSGGAANLLTQAF